MHDNRTWGEKVAGYCQSSWAEANWIYFIFLASHVYFFVSLAIAISFLQRLTIVVLPSETELIDGWCRCSPSRANGIFKWRPYSSWNERAFINTTENKRQVKWKIMNKWTNSLRFFPFLRCWFAFYQFCTERSCSARSSRPYLKMREVEFASMPFIWLTSIEMHETFIGHDFKSLKRKVMRRLHIDECNRFVEHSSWNLRMHRRK